MQHFYKNVPGWATFAPLYFEMVASAPAAPQESHFVEVGSWLGRSAVLMAVEIINSSKPIRFDCVDPWTDGGPDLCHKVAGMKTPIFDQFLRNIEPVKSIIRPVRLPSIEAAVTYRDRSLDFVMIDGSHVHEDVKADISAWLPKMKPGAILGFDDYNWSGVKCAVGEMLDPARVKIYSGAPRPTHSGPCKWAACTC